MGGNVLDEVGGSWFVALPNRAPCELSDTREWVCVRAPEPLSFACAFEETFESGRTTRAVAAAE